MKSAFLPNRYTVVLLDRDHQQVTGFASLHDLAGTRSVAKSALRLDGRVAFAAIHAFVPHMALLAGKQPLLSVTLDDEDDEDQND